MKRITNFTLTILMLVISMCSYAQTIVYVKKTASGANNGTSWTNAYTNLRTALTNAPSGAQVWIAADTYYLPSGSGRSVSFEITNKSLSVFGGFANTGNPNSIIQRVPSIYQTILSGDISMNDTVFSGSTRKTDADRLDNAFNVIRIGMSGQIAATVILDGLIIQDGNANGTSDGPEKWGAGIFCFRSSTGSSTHSVVVRNCVIRYNTAGSSAGIANYLYYINNGTTIMTIHQNKIYQNTADEWAVMGLHMPGSNGLTSYSWNFTSNAVYKNTSVGTNTAILGAVCRNNSDPGSSFIYSINWNTFTANTTGNEGGVICAEGTRGTSSSGNVSEITSTNNIFWANTPATAIYRRSGARDFLGKKLISYNLAESPDSFITFMPLFQNIFGNPLFVNPTGNNFRLSPCSPAINSGSTMIPDGMGNSFSVSASTKDVEDNSRTQHGTIDRGAYEYFGTLAGPSSVNTSASICPGSSFSFDGQNLTQPGIYRDTLSNSAGCDSIITLTLSLKNTSNDTFAVNICEDDSFQFNNTYYKNGGFHQVTFTNVAGCDSIKTLNLIVTNKPLPTISRNGAVLEVNGGTFTTYQWQFNGNDINGATSATYQPTANGNYTVRVTQTNGNITCSNTSSSYAVGFVSIKEFLQYTGVQFYPNPASSQIQVESDQPVQLRIMTLLGTVIKTAEINGLTRIQLNNLPKGVYLIGINGYNMYTRLIIQ